MCNNLHEDSKPIKKEGVGWKLFAVKKSYNLLHSLCDLRPYNHNKGDSTKVRWKNLGAFGGDGFGFFLNINEAKKTKRRWNKEAEIKQYREKEYKVVIIKIKYFGGLGKHAETKFFKKGEVKIALCTSFKILSKKFVLTRFPK